MAGIMDGILAAATRTAKPEACNLGLLSKNNSFKSGISSAVAQPRYNGIFTCPCHSVVDQPAISQSVDYYLRRFSSSCRSSSHCTFS